MTHMETEEPMDCSYLETPRSEPTHALLAVLTHDTRTGRRLKHGPHTWAERSGLDKETVEDLLSDLTAGRFVMKRRSPDGGPSTYVLVAPCKCGQTSSNINNPAGAPPALSKPGARGRGESQVGERSASQALKNRREPTHRAAPESNEIGNGKKSISDQGKRPPLGPNDFERPARKKVVRRRPKTPRQWAGTLANEFVNTLIPSARRQGVRVTAMAVNQKILAGNIRRWIEKDGIEPEEVQSMIRDFVGDYARYHKAGADPAKVFVANRRRLFDSYRERSMIITQPGQMDDLWSTDPADI